MKTLHQLKPLLRKDEVLLWFNLRECAGREFVMPRKFLIPILSYYAFFPIVYRLDTLLEWQLYLGLGLLNTLIFVIWAYFKSPQVLDSFCAISNHRLLYADARGLSAYDFTSVTKVWKESNNNLSIEVASSTEQKLKIVLDDLSSTSIKRAYDLLLAGQRNRIESYAREVGLMK